MLVTTLDPLDLPFALDFTASRKFFTKIIAIFVR